MSDHGQRARSDDKYKFTVFPVPARFVKFKDRMDSKDKPTLKECDECAWHAMRWLERVYWNTLEKRIKDLDSRRDDRSHREKVASELPGKLAPLLLEHFQDLPQATRTAGLLHWKEGAKEMALAKNIAVLVEGSGSGGEALAKLLLSDHFGKFGPEPNNFRDMHDLTWDLLLRQISRHCHGFLTHLVYGLAQRLLNLHNSELATVTSCQLITQWLEHMSSHPSWKKAHLGNVDQKPFIQHCLRNANHWTLRVALTMVRQPHDKSTLPPEMEGEVVQAIDKHARQWEGEDVRQYVPPGGYIRNKVPWDIQTVEVSDRDLWYKERTPKLVAKQVLSPTGKNVAAGGPAGMMSLPLRTKSGGGFGPSPQLESMDLAIRGRSGRKGKGRAEEDDDISMAD